MKPWTVAVKEEMKRKEKKRKEIEKANKGEHSSDDSDTASEKDDDDDNNGYKDDESTASNVLVAEVVPKPLCIGQSGWSRKRAVRKVKPKEGQIVVQCLEEGCAHEFLWWENVVALLPRTKDGNLDYSVYWGSSLAK